MSNDIHKGPLLNVYQKEDNISLLLLEPSIEYYFGQPL
jgi:hypothetical protein